MRCLQEIRLKSCSLFKGHTFASLPLQAGMILRTFTFHLNKKKNKHTLYSLMNIF